MSEDKLQSAVTRGKRAKLLIEDELLNEALDTLKADYIAAWQRTSPTQDDVRERLWLAVQVVGKIRDHLRIVLDDGKLAQAEIDKLTRRTIHVC